MKIEFRDLYHFEAAYSHSTAPVQPASTYAVFCTTLAYLDSSSKPRRIQLLDCSKIPVKATGKIQTEENDVCSMTAVPIGGRLLLVTAGKTATLVIGGGSKPENVGNEIHAYDVNQGKLVWITKGKLPGMVKELCAGALTCDGQGHLFACDTNNSCVQMFSADDGRYRGCFLREGEQGLGKPKLIRWCPYSSSMLVVHKAQEEPYQIAVLNVR